MLTKTHRTRMNSYQRFYFNYLWI